MEDKEVKENQETLNAENNQEQVQEEATAKQDNAENTKKKTEDVAEETPEVSAEEKLQEAEQKLADANDKYLRLMAEFDNYRKHTLKDKAEMLKTAGERVITSILPVIDDIERAQANMDAADDIKAVKEGVNLIFDKLLKQLAKEGLKKIEAIGNDFDTDFHEAIAMIPGADDSMKGKVVDCVQNGYTLNDKVIRHAKVAVAK
jgi:molecular chaperone GrpE